jgi:Zn-dependent membrane protease YugP
MIFSGGYGLYLLIALPALIFGFWAQIKVQSAYKKYSQVRNYTGATGAQIARHILDENKLQNIQIQQGTGILSDYYDPRVKILKLSPAVFQGSTIAAAGVAAHEAGHALQHQARYTPMQLRSLMVPSVQIGSWLGPIIFMVGLFLAGNTGFTVSLIGLLLFGATAVFSMITLPVEINASQRAKVWLINSGSLLQSELPGVNAVLDAAAWTYVAAAVQSLSTLLYYSLLLFGGRRRN